MSPILFSNAQNSYTYKNRNNKSMGPVLIWQNITIGIIVVFEQMWILTRKGHIVNSKGVSKYVISKIQT